MNFYKISVCVSIIVFLLFIYFYFKLKPHNLNDDDSNKLEELIKDRGNNISLEENESGINFNLEVNGRKNVFIFLIMMFIACFIPIINLILTTIEIYLIKVDMTK